MQSASDVLIEPVGGDLVALAQCAALDLTVFPHASLPADASRSVLVARERRGGPVAGFVVTRRIGWRLVINGLAVLPEMRRRGFGSALLTRVEHVAEAAGMSEVVLYVAVENAPALALYAQKGFRQVRRIQGFYRTGDAFEMLLRVGRLRDPI